MHTFPSPGGANLASETFCLRAQCAKRVFELAALDIFGPRYKHPMKPKVRVLTANSSKIAARAAVFVVNELGSTGSSDSSSK